MPPKPSDRDFGPCRAFTDLDLMTRRCTGTLPREEAAVLLRQCLDATELRYVHALSRVMEKSPMTEQTLLEKMQTEVARACGYFKYHFREGSPGAQVSFDDIKSTEKALIARCSELNAAAEFINKRKSYDHCTSIASSLMKQFQSRPQSCGKLIAKYRHLAVGPFSELCGGNLQELMGEYVKAGERGMLDLRQTQLRREMRLVRGYHADALTKCSSSDIQSLTSDPLSVRGSDVLNSSRNAVMTIIEVIQHLPSVESSEAGRGCSIDSSRNVQCVLPRSSSSGNLATTEAEKTAEFAFDSTENTIFVMKHLAEESDSEELQAKASKQEDVRGTAAI